VSPLVEAIAASAYRAGAANESLMMSGAVIEAPFARARRLCVRAKAVSNHRAMNSAAFNDPRMGS
jgi:hypothetical protein